MVYTAVLLSSFKEGSVEGYFARGNEDVVSRGGEYRRWQIIQSYLKR